MKWIKRTNAAVTAEEVEGKIFITTRTGFNGSYSEETREVSRADWRLWHQAHFKPWVE